MNIGVGSIITKGLGGPACNLLIFGGVRLYIEPLNITPTPTPTISITPDITPTPSGTPVVTPTPTIPPVQIGGGGAGFYDRDEEQDLKFKLTFRVAWGKRKFEKSFIVDSFKKDKVIKQVGRINKIRVTFKTVFKKLTNNRFIVRWKK